MYTWHVVGTTYNATTNIITLMCVLFFTFLGTRREESELNASGQSRNLICSSLLSGVILVA